jgi:hypothetical protein
MARDLFQEAGIDPGAPAGGGRDLFAEAGIVPTPPTQPQGGVGEYALDTLKNIPKSLFDIYANTLKAVAHPVDTAKNLFMTALGRPQEVNAIGDFYAKRYGGLENIKNTVRQDPAGVAMDLSGLLGLGGGAASATGKLIQSPKLTQAGDVVANIGRNINPINAAGRAVRGVTSAVIPESLELGLYNSVLKQPRTKKMNPELFNQNAREGIQERIVPNARGLENIYGKLDDINGAIDTVIADAADKGLKVPTRTVVGAMDSAADLYKKMLDPAEYSNAMEHINGIKERIGNAYPDGIPIEIAQEAKKAIYLHHKKNYGELKGIQIETDKQQARGLRQGIEESIAEGVPQPVPPISSEMLYSDMPVIRNPGREQVIGKVEGEPLAYGNVPREPANFYKGTIPDTSFAPGAKKADQTVYLQKPQQPVEQTPSPLIRREADFSRETLSPGESAAINTLKNQKGNIPMLTDAANYIKDRIKKTVSPEDITNAILEKYPDIHSLNAKEARLINLKDAVEKAYMRIQKHNAVQLQDVLATVAVGAPTGSLSTGLKAGILNHIIAQPEINSRIAFALNSARTKNFVPKRQLPTQVLSREGSIFEQQ